MEDNVISDWGGGVGKGLAYLFLVHFHNMKLLIRIKNDTEVDNTSECVSCPLTYLLGDLNVCFVEILKPIDKDYNIIKYGKPSLTNS